MTCDAKNIFGLGFSATSIKIWRISTLTPSRLSGSIRKQRVIVCDLQMVYFNPFYVLLYFKVCCFWTSRFGHMFLKSAVKFYLVLSFFIFFILITKHGKPKVKLFLKGFQIQNNHKYWGGGGGENKLGPFCQHSHLQLMLAYNYCHLYFTQWML